MLLLAGALAWMDPLSMVKVQVHVALVKVVGAGGDRGPDTGDAGRSLQRLQQRPYQPVRDRRFEEL